MLPFENAVHLPLPWLLGEKVIRTMIFGSTVACLIIQNVFRHRHWKPTLTRFGSQKLYNRWWFGDVWCSCAGWDICVGWSWDFRILEMKRMAWTSDGHDFLMSADGRTMNYLVWTCGCFVWFAVCWTWRSLSYKHMCILYLLQISIAYYMCGVCIYIYTLWIHKLQKGR